MTGAYPVLHLGPVRSTRPWARTYRGTPASVPEARRFVGELLAGCPARAGRARVGLGETQPAVGIGTAGHETQVVAVAPLSDQQAEIEQRAADTLGRIVGSPYPRLAGRRGQLDPELAGRRGQAPGDKGEVPGPYA